MPFEDAGFDLIPSGHSGRIGLVVRQTIVEQCPDCGVHLYFVPTIGFQQEFLGKLTLLRRSKPLNIGKEFEDHRCRLMDSEGLASQLHPLKGCKPRGQC